MVSGTPDAPLPQIALPQAAEDEGPKFDWMPAGCKAMADGEVSTPCKSTELLRPPDVQSSSYLLVPCASGNCLTCF